MNLIRRYIRNILLEDIKAQANWRAGKDVDWPNYHDRSQRKSKGMNSPEVPVIDPSKDSYVDTGYSILTHGGLSHMIKHLNEWDKGIVNNLVQEIRTTLENYIKDGNKKITLLSKKGTTRQVDSVSELALGTFLTYLDYINDKMFEKGGYAGLTDLEKKVIDVASSRYNTYVKIAEHFESKAVDVKDEAFPDIELLAEFLETGPVIEYQEIRNFGKTKAKRKCIMDLSTGWFVGYDTDKSNGKYLTIFQMQKQASKGVYKSLLLLSPTKRSGNKKKQEWTHTKNKSQLSKEYTNLRILAMIANDKRKFIDPDQAAQDKKNSKMRIPIPVTKGTEDLAKIKAKRKKRK